jgi:hypothetical protein
MLLARMNAERLMNCSMDAILPMIALARQSRLSRSRHYRCRPRRKPRSPATAVCQMPDIADAFAWRRAVFRDIIRRTERHASPPLKSRHHHAASCSGLTPPSAAIHYSRREFRQAPPRRNHA